MCYSMMTLVGTGNHFGLAPSVGRCIDPRCSAHWCSVSLFWHLLTGSLWGKPMWGTWWVWDAQTDLSTDFIHHLYGPYCAYPRAIEEPTTAARSLAVITLIGFINIPIIKFSVDWWNTLHQPASVSRLAKPAMDTVFLYPLLSMAIGLFHYCFSPFT